MENIINKIHWRKVPKNSLITLGQGAYWYQNQLVFWHVAEAGEAQNFLNSRTGPKCDKNPTLNLRLIQQ